MELKIAIVIAFAGAANILASPEYSVDTYVTPKVTGADYGNYINKQIIRI